MSQLSRDDVISIVGPMSDIVVAEIIATGITDADLAAAHARVVRDQTQHHPGASLEPGPIAQVVGLLERIKSEGRLSTPFGEAGSVLR